jgi:hypothetical protein
MGRCRFESVFNDLKNNEDFTPTRCDEDAGSSSVCPFHNNSKTYWDNVTIERFRTNVKDSVNGNKTLNCIGYYFPTNISFRHIFSDLTMQGELHRDVSQLTYDIDINLCNSIFEGQVEFSYCTFKKPLNLAGAKFDKQVLFRM